MSHDSKLLAEAYVNEISRMPEPNQSEGESRLATAADQVEDAASRLAGLIPRNQEHPTVERALRHMGAVLADLVEFFDGPGQVSGSDEMVPNVKRF